MRIFRGMDKEQAEKFQGAAKKALEAAIQNAINNEWEAVTANLMDGGILLRTISGVACLNEENVLLYKRLIRASLSQAVFLTLTADNDGEFSDGDDCAHGVWVAVDLLEVEFSDKGARVPNEDAAVAASGESKELIRIIRSTSTWI